MIPARSKSRAGAPSADSRRHHRHQLGLSHVSLALAHEAQWTRRGMNAGLAHFEWRTGADDRAARDRRRTSGSPIALQPSALPVIRRAVIVRDMAEPTLRQPASADRAMRDRGQRHASRGAAPASGAHDLHPFTTMNGSSRATYTVWRERDPIEASATRRGSERARDRSRRPRKLCAAGPWRSSLLVHDVPRCRARDPRQRRLFSASAIVTVVFMTASGLSEMLSMPCSTRNRANSG